MLALVVSNLLYPLGAVVVAALLCLLVVLRHRRPKSVEANMRAFNRGLQALAPEDHGSGGPLGRHGARQAVRRPPPPRAPYPAGPRPGAQRPGADNELEAETG